MNAMIFWIWVGIILLFLGTMLFGWLAISAVTDMSMVKALIAVIVGLVVVPKYFSIFRA
jgi:hypothetical protein